MKALAFSGGKDSLACLHLMLGSLDVAIYVNTGFAYPETLKIVDYAKGLLPVDVVHVNRWAQNYREGIPSDVVPIDYTTLGQQITGEKPVKVQSYLGCCYENISRPLLDRAKELGVTELVYGQRNDEAYKSPARNGDVVEGVKRIHPIENMTAKQVLTFLSGKMEIPAHFAIKHSSLDCYDCTAFAKASQDRIEWTRQAHPELFKAYRIRAEALRSTFV